MGKKNFIDWLQNTTKLSSYSIGRYANAIDNLSKELNNYGIMEKNLYNIYDTEIIDILIIHPKFQEKNNKRNRMYSAALNHFKSYIKYFNDREFQAELLKEEVEFEKYLKENTSEAENIVDKAKDKPNHSTINNQKIWSRNPRYAIEVVAANNYLCEVDAQHKHFISKYTKKNYVEAHHLIPIKFQDQFENSLDIYANIVSLCLVCHKKIHYGLFEEKKEILNKLFSERKKRLKVCGIDITIDELYNYYKD